MATRDTVGAGWATSGLTLAGTHKYSAASNLFSSSFQAIGFDRSKWPTTLQGAEPKEFYFKSNVVLTFSQNSDGTEGTITFAADEWHVLPFELVTTYGYVKAANATNTSEYYFVAGK